MQTENHKTEELRHRERADMMIQHFSELSKKSLDKYALTGGEKYRLRHEYFKRLVGAIKKEFSDDL